MFHFYSNMLIMIVCMIYLFIVVVFVVIKLNEEAELVKKFRLFRGSAASVEAVKSVKLMGFRILLYPTIMIISHSGLVVNQTAYDLANIASDDLDIFSLITGGMLGTLNFIAFCCDPTIHSAFRKIYLRFITRNTFRDESETTNRTKFFTINIDLNNYASPDSLEHLTPQEAFDKSFNAFVRTL
ncbi:hypothetical protein K502DRAFT_369175 [Neoconidiobolus thromboides FSU 785]|nr:hypothetical protein K502DRAFT_369175 [Neoconidiobolus thromboides FSU 785]